MLVIFSDIHLTDESTANNAAPEAFTGVLLNEILRRSNSRSRDISEINVVLLGDIFDLVRTDYWMKAGKNKRPWNGKLDARTAMNILPCIEDLETETSKAFTGMLNDIKKNSNVPVQVTYVLGNHDRAFNNFASLQDMTRSRLHAFNPHEVVFTTQLISDVYGVICRHGHEYDDSNFGWELCKAMNNDKYIFRFDPAVYKVQSIGEVITAELMSGMIWRLKNEFGGNDDFVVMMKDVNNVRPVSKAVSWMKWKSCGNKKYSDVLLNVFREALRSTLDTSLARAWDDIETDFLFSGSGDLTDKLGNLSALIDNCGFDNLENLVQAFECFSCLYRKIIPERDEYLEGARHELQLRTNAARQTVFMGHTHQPAQALISAGRQNDVKMYINTGTYLPLIQMTMDGSSFASLQQMTMAFVYTAEELRSSHPACDLWNGTRVISDCGFPISD